MVDWVGNDGVSTADRYREMGERQLRGISPTYERLCLGVAGDREVLHLLDMLPPPKRQPNLLLGAVRFLDGPVSTYEQFRDFVTSEWDLLSATISARRTQTNEALRCTAYLPVLAALPQPLALLEVGASAGLCLYPDRYAYRYDDRPVLGSSSLVLECRTSGRVPVPSRLPSVVWRRGIDLNPLDVRAEQDMRWLQSLVWPEQTTRFEVLRHAIRIARQEPVEIVRGDLTTELLRVASTAPRNATLVVLHSAVIAYLDDAQRARFRAELETVRAERPLVWVSNEGPGVRVDTPAPEGAAVPFVLARDGVPLAFTSPHGDWLNWFA